MTTASGGVGHSPAGRERGPAADRGRPQVTIASCPAVPRNAGELLRVIRSLCDTPISLPGSKCPDSVPTAAGDFATTAERSATAALPSAEVIIMLIGNVRALRSV